MGSFAGAVNLGERAPSTSEQIAVGVCKHRERYPRERTHRVAKCTWQHRPLSDPSGTIYTRLSALVRFPMVSRLRRTIKSARKRNHISRSPLPWCTNCKSYSNPCPQHEGSLIRGHWVQRCHFGGKGLRVPMPWIIFGAYFTKHRKRCIIK